MIDLNQIASGAHDIAKKRGYPYSDTRLEPLLKYCAGETVEASFAASMYEKEHSDLDRELLKGELADIMMCVLIACSELDVDAEGILLECLSKNEKRIRMKAKK